MPSVLVPGAPALPCSRFSVSVLVPPLEKTLEKLHHYRMDEDVRWKQRFQNYQKALLTVQNAIALSKERALSDLEKQGLIQGFEFTFELAWNVMKDYLEANGITGIIGSKGAIRRAFTNGLVSDGQVWMDMIEDRNRSSHSYDQETADNLARAIVDIYCVHLGLFAEKMSGLEQTEL